MDDGTPPIITDRFLDDLERRGIGHRVSVLRRLVGLPVKGAAGRRIDRALADAGLRPGCCPSATTSAPPPRAA